MSNVENKENPKAGPNGGPKKSMNLFWVYGIIIVVIGMLLLFNNTDRTVDITVSDYNRFLQGGQVDRITIYPQQEVRVTIKADTLKNKEHADAFKRKGYQKPEPKGPHYKFFIGANDAYQN